MIKYGSHFNAEKKLKYPGLTLIFLHVVLIDLCFVFHVTEHPEITYLASEAVLGKLNLRENSCVKCATFCGIYSLVSIV